jgi:hypothetical protein
MEVMRSRLVLRHNKVVMTKFATPQPLSCKASQSYVCHCLMLRHGKPDTTGANTQKAWALPEGD